MGKEESRVQKASFRTGHPNKPDAHQGKGLELYTLLSREPMKGIRNKASDLANFLMSPRIRVALRID